MSEKENNIWQGKTDNRIEVIEREIKKISIDIKNILSELQTMRSKPMECQEVFDHRYQMLNTYSLKTSNICNQIIEGKDLMTFQRFKQELQNNNNKLEAFIKEENNSIKEEIKKDLQYYTRKNEIDSIIKKVIKECKSYEKQKLSNMLSDWRNILYIIVALVNVYLIFFK